jgi:hypothetical protein
MYCAKRREEIIGIMYSRKASLKEEMYCTKRRGEIIDIMYSLY